MKKLLFFILILCAAGYWGIREGNSSVKDFSPPRAASKSEPRRTEKNWFEELTGRIGTLITTPWKRGNQIRLFHRTQKTAKRTLLFPR